VTYGHGLTKAQLLDDVRRIIRVRLDGISPRRLVALAMSAQVYGNDPVPPAKVLRLRGEERAIACPSMDKDKGRLARAAILEGQLGTVVHDQCHDPSPSPRVDVSLRFLAQPPLRGALP